MNAPNFKFDGEGHSNQRSLAVSDGSRSITYANPETYVSFGADEGRDQSGPDYRKYFFFCLSLVVKYRWLIIALAGLALAIGFIQTFTATPIYQATATIQIDRQAPKVVKNEAVQDRDFGGGDLRFYKTQYDLLRSRSLSERVAADLDLAGAKDFLNPPSTSAWGKLRSLILPSADSTTNDNGNFEQRKAAAAGTVQSGILIEPVTNSSLVRISFDSPSPDWAQRIANGVADSFVTSNLDRRYEATAYARNFLKERLEELKLKLEESEKALVAYAEEKELIGDVRVNAEDKKGSSLADSDLTALNSALQKVTTERMYAQNLWEQANESKDIGLSQILEDSAIKALRTQRAALMADYQNKLSTFKPAYPDMLRLKAQIDQVSSEIKSAADVIKQSLKARYEAAQQQEVLLKTKIDETKRGVLDTRNKEIQYNILKREADTNRSLYDGLLQQYKDAGVAGAVGTNNVTVVDRAQKPGGPFKPDLRKNLLMALVLGLVTAGCLIVLFEIIDDTFKSPEDVEQQLGVSVLGVIPFAEGNILTQLNGSSNPLAEAFRSFRTALQFSTDRGAPRTLTVTSARPGEGKSTTALALSINLTQLGMKVLLIDADLRNPSQHRNLKRSNEIGLANYLAGVDLSGNIFQQTDIDGLYFMATGPLPPNPAELLAGPRMSSLLSTAMEKVDTIIIDSPPVMGLADAPLLASMSSGTLLVIATADTRRGIVKGALKRLQFARARVLGAVMNKSDFRTHGYGYGYGYGQAALEYYGYGQNAKAQVEHSPQG